MTTTLGAKPVIDTSEYKSRLKDMNADLRVLESGFRASSASMGDWAATGTGLETRIKSLNAQMDVQRNKVALLKAVYEEIKNTKGEDTRATKAAEVEYNNAAATLGKMQNELNQTEIALVEMKVDTENAGKEIKDFENKADQAGNAVKGTGSKLLDFSIIMTGVNSVVNIVRQSFYMFQAAVRATLNIISSLVTPASNLSETLSKTSVVFGDSADAVIKFGENAAGALGLSENAALSAAATYGNLFRAFGTTEEASAEMSVELVKLAADLASFNNMEVTDVLDKLRAGLTGESEPLKTLGIAMNQTRLQAKALELGLIEAGEPMDANAKALAAYAIMMEDTALAQGDFERTSEGLANQQRILAAQFENTKAMLGGFLMPAVLSGVSVLTGYLERFTGIIKNFSGTDNLFPGLTSLFTDIVNDIAASAPKMLTAGLGIIKSILTSIKNSLPTLLTAATDILTSLLNFIVEALPIIIPMGIQILLSLVNAILTNLPMLIDAALQAIITLAQGLGDALPTLIPAVVQAIITIVQTLLANMPLLIDAALQLILGLTYGLIAAIPILLPAIPQIIQALVDAINLSLPMIVDAALLIIFSLATALIGGKSEMGKSGIELLNEFIAKMKTMAAQLKSIGVFMVQGIWEGIKGATAWLYQRIKEFIDDIIQSILDAEGASSPAKRFMPAGKFAVQGFVGGMFAEASKLEGQMSSLMNNVQFSPAFAAANAAASQSVINNNNGDTLTVNGLTIPGDAKSLTLSEIMEYLGKRG